MPAFDGPSDLWINGTWRTAAENRRFEVSDPATGEVITTVADAGVTDARQAAGAAAAAGPAWARQPPRERAEILRNVYALMTERTGLIADLITLENGKALVDATAEVAYAAEFFRWYSEEAVRIPGHLTTSPSGQRRIIELAQPVGVSLLIAPWNLPAAMITRKVAPALAAGCTVVVKPSDQTPLTALLLADLLHRAGVPDGVVNIVPTTRNIEVVADLIDAGPVRMLSFTGSTATGRALLSQASARVLNVGMELGGNAPFIVFDDADLDVAVAGAITAKMRHNAEACTAANRFLVHRNIHEDFTDRLVKAMGDLVVGPGATPGVQVGPLASDRARTGLHHAVDQAVDAGARLRLGGERDGRPGYFFAPTVLDRLEANAAILGHELFGPVAPVVVFDHEEQVIAMANSTEVGLGSYVFSADLGRALRVGERLEAGMVGINTGIFSDAAAPFGGVKQSGIGREGGRAGIHEFLETKYMAVQW